MFDEQKELKKIERALTKLLKEEPELRQIAEENFFLRQWNEKLDREVSEWEEQILEADWMNDIAALERERIEFAPELTPDGARQLFWRYMLLDFYDYKFGREIDDQMFLVYGIAIYIYKKKRELLLAEMLQEEIEYTDRVLSQWEEVVRLRELGGEWQAKSDKLVELGKKYHRFAKQKIGAKIAAVQDVLKQMYVSVCSSLTYYRLNTALGLKDFTETGETPWPTKIFNEELVKGVAQLKPVEAQIRIMDPADELELSRLMFKLREMLSDLDSDVLDMLYTFWMLQAEGDEDSGAAAIDDLLRLRGLKPKLGGQGRRGGFEQSQRDEVLESISRLQNILIRVSQPVRGGPTDGISLKHFEGYLVVVTDYAGHERADQIISIRVIVFQPGDALRVYLLGPGRQTAWLSARALKYSHHTHPYEKRLTRYLSWLWGNHAVDKKYTRKFKVKELLNIIGLELDDRNPSRTYDRLDKIFETLEQDKIIRESRYVNRDDRMLRTRGWVRKWLKSTLEIEPAEEILTLYTDDSSSS